MASMSEDRLKCHYHILPNGKPCGRCCSRNALPGWTTCRVHRKNGKARQGTLAL